MKRLNIGCGFNQIIDNYINIDYMKNYKYEKFKFYIKKILKRFNLYHHPNFSNFEKYFSTVIILDVKKGLPFDDNSIDVVYSSHLIEHFSKEEGIFFLSEIYRILKKDGILRLVTPDLKKFIEAYFNNDNKFLFALQSQYPEFKNCNKNIDALNKVFYAAGHKMIYDYDTIYHILLNIGFSQIEKKDNYSSYINDIIKYENKRIENLVIEAIK